MEVITQSNLRKNIYNILKEVSSENKELEVTINSKSGANDGVVIVSKREWETLQEELYLQRTGTLDYVFSLMENETEDDFEEA